MSKVGIIGMGRVGSLICYDIIRRDICNEVVLIDIMENLVEGHAEDIRHALSYKTKTNIIAGTYNDLKDCDVIVITAGKPRTKDMASRLDLAKINQRIIKDVEVIPGR